MIKSFRLTPELERRLEEASARAGMSVSDFIREAVEQRCDAVLGHSLLDDLGDMVGAVDGGRFDSRHTGRAFAEIVAEKHRKRR